MRFATCAEFSEILVLKSSLDIRTHVQIHQIQQNVADLMCVRFFVTI